MYYIYHVPGKKIGCTKYLETRLRQQGYSEYEILEEHTDIYVASDREVELQKEYGYKVDTAPYYKSIKPNALTHEARVRGGQNANLKQHASKGGIIGGATNRDSGHMSRIGKQWKGKKQALLTCPHCNKSGGNTMLRWHFDNCKKRA